MGRDPDQLTNLAANPEFSQTLEKARGLLAEWTEQTGDTVPNNPTPDRDARSGEPKKKKEDHRHLEMPGDASGAQQINHSGPIVLN